MDWFRLGTGYYRDRAILRAGEAAEVLFLRCLAYSGAEESRGIVPKHVLPMLTPTRTKARLDALLRNELLIDLGDDVRIRSWDRWQESLDKEADRRRKDRERKAAERAASRAVSGGLSADSPGTVRKEIPHKEVEVEKDKTTTWSAELTATPLALVPAPPSPDLFEEFWAVWPRKVAKERARKAHARALKTTKPDVILAAAVRYRDDPKRSSSPIEYTAHAASWLNDQRWEDEPPEPVGEFGYREVAVRTDW